MTSTVHARQSYVEFRQKLVDYLLPIFAWENYTLGRQAAVAQLYRNVERHTSVAVSYKVLQRLPSSAGALPDLEIPTQERVDAALEELQVTTE